MGEFYKRLMKWLRGTERPELVARLSESQVIQIAQAAASTDRNARDLTLASRAMKDGRIVWSVSQAAIGNVLVVDVDDETGVAMSVRRVGLR